jgi:hypothetical protein
VLIRYILDMSKSHRKSKWADPSVTPYTGPYQPSPHRERKLGEQFAARKRNLVRHFFLPTNGG